MTDFDKPILVGGIGEINFGKQYRQGNRVYDSGAVGMCLNAQPVGNAVTVNVIDAIGKRLLPYLNEKTE